LNWAMMVLLLAGFQSIEEVRYEGCFMADDEFTLHEHLVAALMGAQPSFVVKRLVVHETLATFIKATIEYDYVSTGGLQCQNISVEVDCTSSRAEAYLQDCFEGKLCIVILVFTYWRLNSKADVADPPYIRSLVFTLKDCHLVQAATLCLPAGHLRFVHRIIAKIPRHILKLIIKVDTSLWDKKNLLGQDSDEDLRILIDLLQAEFTNLEVVDIAFYDRSSDSVSWAGDVGGAVDTAAQELGRLGRFYKTSIAVGTDKRKLPHGG